MTTDMPGRLTTSDGRRDGGIGANLKEALPMDVKIEFLMRAGQDETTEALREYARRRLFFALRRFRHRVRQVIVRAVDENGPRRGIDSRCSMTADLIDGRPIFVEARAAWPFAAIKLAAGRLSEALRRDTDRHGARRTLNSPLAI